MLVECFFPSIIRYCNREKEPKRIYLIARVKQMRLAFAGLEKKKLLFILYLSWKEIFKLRNDHRVRMASRALLDDTLLEPYKDFAGVLVDSFK